MGRMKKDSPNENALYEDLGKELIKQQVGSQWANLVYKSLGIGYSKLMQFDWLRMSKEERFDFKLASHSIAFLENLHCTQIVNLASYNHIFTAETLRYFQRTNIEPFSYEKLLWLVASSNMNLNQKKSDGLGV